MIKFETILEKNFNYFVKNIEPYYFILYTYQNKALVIDVKKSNFGHLIGYEKSSNILHASKSGTELYKLFRDKKIKSLFDFIDKERFYSSQLTLNEIFIYNKVVNFIDIFDSLINTTNIRIYKKIPGDDFNADYLQVKRFEHAIGYLGIIGSSENDYHYFNSLIYEKNRNGNYKGISFRIKRLERIPKNEFVKDDYTFIKSKHHKEELQPKHFKSNKKIFDYLKHKNEINKRLHEGIILKVGCYGKKSVQIYKDKSCIEQHFEKLINAENAEQVISFINETYF